MAGTEKGKTLLEDQRSNISHPWGQGDTQGEAKASTGVKEAGVPDHKSCCCVLKK